MSATVGLGLDLIDLAHFRIHYGEEDPELLSRCFTDGELSSVGTGVDRLARLAARFAAKEAACKALGGAEGIGLPDIETGTGDTGRPEIVLHGTARALAGRAA